MILLDTNVVSELRKAHRADPKLRAWADAQVPATLFLSVITILELEIGVGLMERRDVRQGAALRRWLENKVLPAFDGRILAFDTPAARRCAPLHVPDRRPDRDAMLAATALAHGLSVATRNVADFRGIAVTVIDPWRDATV